MEKWSGIIEGSNRGIIGLDLNISQNNEVTGNFNLYDTEGKNFSGRMQGVIKNKRLKGKVYDFTPCQEGIPKEGTVNLAILPNKKEMKGKWSTDIDLKGKCVLFKFSTKEQALAYSPQDLTLETKDIPIYFCTFDKKSIKNIFEIMTKIAKSIRAGREKDIFPPIYSITYDKEERLRTYSLNDFLNKFNEADKIWYVGFEFKGKTPLKNIFINISYRPDFVSLAGSNVIVESVDKDIVTMIPEMVRGLVSKTKNKHSWHHHWLFEAVIQILAVTTILALSFFIGRKLAITFQSEALRFYGFIGSLIILSNLWTYILRMVLYWRGRLFPVVEITNKPKNRLTPGIIIAVIASIIGSIIVRFFILISELLHTSAI